MFAVVRLFGIAGLDQHGLVNEQAPYFVEQPVVPAALQPLIVPIEQPPAVALSQATSEYPSREQFPGPYNFEMEIVNKKQASWEYSASLNKVFIKAGCTLPVNFRISSCEPGLYVRAVAVYVDTNAATVPVLRCPLHLQITDPINNGYDHLDHVLSSSSRSAKYELNERTLRRSVCVPLKGPQAGSDWETIPFAVMCLNSCNNGIGRRSLEIIFTLEREQQVLGRRVLPLRSCAAPKRDCDRETDKKQKDDAKSVKQEAPETANEGPVFRIPVAHVDDYLTLVQEARELTARDCEEGEAKGQQLQKYDEIIAKYSQPC
ncbi:hypothetical protein B566_EDAN001479 [Ephemera danica]|nr:hypothetical protein B566_EDAN001479 [Ephemera danica]